MTGLKINFRKSELLCFGEASEAAVQYAELFGCAQGQFPIGASLMKSGNI
jgi:hypothetical protein